MGRPESHYQLRRREQERLGDLARFLSILAALFFTLVTVQAAGYTIAIPFLR
jgi:hypothetical protein